jgi:Zn-dependent protease
MRVFGSSYKIATVWGIPIKLHVSLLFLLGYFALRYGMRGGPMAIGYILLLETLIFASIALHELGHSFVAIRKGCRVREITLMFIGGAAQMERIPPRPWDEFQMAIAGPLVSLTLGAAGYFGGQRIFMLGLPFLGSAVMTAGLVNFFLAGFNLLPSFPMDGGRILRALLSRRMGRLRATRAAARTGRTLAVIFGVLGFLANPPNWVLVVIAFFVFSAAGNEYRMVEMEERLREQGYDAWGDAPSDDGLPDHDDDTDRVRISPPPYREGPPREADIEPAGDDDPFGLFRRR